MSAFVPIFAPKKFKPIILVSTKKLHPKLSYEKGASKMLVKLTPYLQIPEFD